jgi:NAD(P)-dependent dehydrogenase (short-subunit alcohol dehydrogenase family)
MDNLFSLRNRVVIITGGTGAIGRETVVKLAVQGADIAIVDIVPEDEAEDLVLSLKALGRYADYFRCDVADSAQVSRMVEAVFKKYGKIDVLLNNAAFARLNMAANLSDEDWDITVRVSLRGSFICSREVAKFMIPQGYGNIICMASIAGIIGLPRGTAHHSAAKAGVMGLTRALAVEWAKYGIRVNAIVPGQIMTPLLKKIMDQPGNAEQILANIPLGRVGRPDEIAAAVIYLASDASSFITGHSLVIDGGATIA